MDFVIGDRRCFVLILHYMISGYIIKYNKMNLI